MKRPALGIKPRWLWKEENELGVVIPYNKIKERHKELCATIKRRIDNNDNLLIEWVREYNDIIKYLKKENVK